jgi:hypothetical protein
VTYQASDEGSVMVSYPADPLLPKLINTIGVNLAKAMGLALDGEPVPVPVVKPTASPVEPEGSSAFDPSAEPTRARVPMLELEPVTEPGLNALNPDERLARDAKMMARSVWLGGGERRHQLLQGIPHDVQEELLAYAVTQGWVAVSEDGLNVKPGSTRPIDQMPLREPMRWIERVMSWGPTPGGDW